MISRESLTFRIARLAFVAYTLVAVASCGSGSDSDGSSSAVVTKSESVQSFVGTVSCDAIGGEPQSQAFETRVIFDRAVYRGMSQEVSSAAAIQVGGLAGSVVKGARSQLSVTIPSSSLFSGSAIDFKVTATPETGTYAETGRWTIGVDANGKATLKGDSTATLGPVANGWRAACRWNLAEAQAPVGPVSYGHIEQRYGTPPTDRPVASKGLASPVTKGSDSGCGDAWGWVSDGLFVAAALVAIPTGGASIAAVITVGALASGVAGSAAGNACLDSQLAAMNQQLAIQGAQIQQIDTYLGVATNVLYQKFWQVESQITTTSAYLWQQAVNGISPAGSSTGLFGSFMNPDGVGLWNYAMQPAAGAPADPTQLALNDTAFNHARIQVAANSSDFTRYLNQLSGTSIVIPPQSSCNSDCSPYVVQVSDSALVQLYRNLFLALQSNIDTYAQPGQTPGIPAPINQNIVPLYDQYNAMLVKFWTQAVYAMQQAQTMEWTVNQMNYFRGTTAGATQPTQIGSWGAVAGTHYQYGGQSLQVETDRYNTAQKNLAKAYAARINQLYLNTLNFIVSDVPVQLPVGAQAYPTTPVSYTFNGVTYTEKKPIDYSGQMGLGIIQSIPAPTAGTQGATPMSLLPKVAVTKSDLTTPADWVSGAVLYQFSGLKDGAACVTSLQAYTASTTGGTVQGWLQTPGACPSIFTLADGSALSYTCDTASPPNCEGSVYDGNTLQPYTGLQSGSTGNPMKLSVQVPNNLKFCDPNTPGTKWEKQRRGLALNCDQWYVPTYLAAGFPRANVPAANGDQSFYTDQTGFGYSVNVPGGCSDNLVSPIGNKYPAITTLTGSWPSGAPSSCAVIPSVPLTGTSSLQSPIYTGSRTENVNYETGNGGGGCSIGWIGGGLSNKLPDFFGYLPWGDDLSFSLRLPRAAGNYNETSGFVLPLYAGAGCYGQVGMVTVYPPSGDLATYGFQCAPIYSATQFTCTITDGTAYTFTLSTGKSSILNVQTVAP